MSKGKCAAPDSAAARLCEWRGLNGYIFIPSLAGFHIRRKMCLHEFKIYHNI